MDKYLKQVCLHFAGWPLLLSRWEAASARCLSAWKLYGVAYLECPVVGPTAVPWHRSSTALDKCRGCLLPPIASTECCHSRGNNNNNKKISYVVYIFLHQVMAVRQFFEWFIYKATSITNLEQRKLIVNVTTIDLFSCVFSFLINYWTII